MLNRLLQSILVGTAGYIIVVLFGLISFHPLSIIFWRGLWMLFGGSAGAFVVLSLVEMLKSDEDKLEDSAQKLQNSPRHASKKYQDNEVSEEEENLDDSSGGTAENDHDQDEQENAVESGGEEFSPMDPPVLETED